MRSFVLGLVLGVVLLPVAMLVAGYAGRLRTEATSEPLGWESSLARKALDASVARQAPHVQNALTPTEANLLAGMVLFRTNCAGCHGDSDQRRGTQGFYPRVPQFAFEHPKKPDWQMFWIVKHGVRYSGMGAWKDLFHDEKIWLTVTFLSHLDSLPPTVAARWQKLATPAPNKKK